MKSLVELLPDNKAMVFSHLPTLSHFLTDFILKLNFRGLKCSRKIENPQIKYETLVLPNLKQQVFLYLFPTTMVEEYGSPEHTNRDVNI